MTRVEFMDAGSIGDLERSINHFLASKPDAEIIDIKYNMVTDPAADRLLYMSAMVIYKESESK